LSNTNRRENVRYRVNRRGEMVEAKVVPLPETTSPVGPTPREARRLNVSAERVQQGIDNRRAALMKRLEERRVARQEERDRAIREAAARAGDPDDNVTLEKIRLGDITVAQSFQRLLDEDRAVGYAMDFSWEAFQAVSVNRVKTQVPVDPNDPEGPTEEREIIDLTDGQHRLYAALLCFGEDVLVKCVVTNLTTKAKRARLFIRINDERTGLNYNTKFRARLEAEDDEPAEQVMALLASFHLDYTKPGETRNLPGRVTAVSTVESMVRQGGVTSARAALSVLKECFGDDPVAYRDYMMAGMWQFCVRYDGLYNRERLIAALKRDGLEKVNESIPDFKTGVNSSPAAAACGAIHFAYNWHLPGKDQLPAPPNETRNRYAGLVRKAARSWLLRHETNGAALVAARPLTGLYAPGAQRPSRATTRRAYGLPGSS